MSLTPSFLSVKSYFSTQCLFWVLVGVLSIQSAQAQDEVERFFGQSGEAVKGPQNEAIENIWKQILVGDRRQRRDARAELISYGPSAARRLLRELDSESREVRRQALLTLGRVEGEDVRRALRVGLARGPEQSDEAMLRRYAMALGRCGDASDADSLIKRFRKAKRRETRRAMLYALGRLGGAEHAQDVARFWDREKSQEFRSALLLVLGRLGGPGGERALSEGLKSHKEGVRRIAALALADHRGEKDTRRIARLLLDREEEVRQAGLLALALSDFEDLDKLGLDRKFLRHSDPETRALSALALARSGSEKSLAALVARAGAKGESLPSVQAVLALALGRFKHEAAAEPLVRYLDEGAAPVAEAALLGLLLRSRGGADLDHLIHKARFPNVALTALEILVWKAPSAGVEKAKALLEAKGTPDFLRQSAATIVKEMKDGEVGLQSRFGARIQLRIDRLGGSPEWELLERLHAAMLRIENLDGPLGSRGVPRVSPAGQERAPDRMSKEEEDLRLWLDRHPYFDRRREREIR